MQNTHQARKPMQNLYFFKRQLAVSLDTNRFGGAERDRTADPLLAKQVLSQLSYSPISSIAPVMTTRVRQQSTSPAIPSSQNHHSQMQMVGPGRLELPTPRLSSVCSNQLSYGPIRETGRRGFCLLEERETWTARLAISSGLKVSVTYCVSMVT
jgi:hypothetical protein